MNVSLMCSLELVPLKAEKDASHAQKTGSWYLFPTRTPVFFILEFPSPGLLFLSMTENLRKEI